MEWEQTNSLKWIPLASQEHHTYTTSCITKVGGECLMLVHPLSHALVTLQSLLACMKIQVLSQKVQDFIYIHEVFYIHIHHTPWLLLLVPLLSACIWACQIHIWGPGPVRKIWALTGACNKEILGFGRLEGKSSGVWFSVQQKQAYSCLWESWYCSYFLWGPVQYSLEVLFTWIRRLCHW